MVKTSTPQHPVWVRQRAVVGAGFAVVLLVAGLISGVRLSGGWGHSPAAAPGTPVTVHEVTGRKVPIPPMRPYRQPPTSWPTASTATVQVTGRSALAAGTPVWIGAAVAGAQAATAAAGPDTRVQVAVAPHTVATTLGVHGVVFSVGSAPGSLGGRVHVSVDYSGFAHAYG